ncbi:MAG: GTP pyrophosphokinase, partial [Muribaculaceae bacterium]|nr:GTP pyrophosphokinase [Muribaculaceae bacterium]
TLSTPEPAREAKPESTPQQINTKQIYVLRNTATGPNYRLAGCCSPLPGDDVMGYINDSGTVEIHALDCPQAQVLKAGFGSRIVATEWEKSGEELFLAHLRIEGIDRHGILQELMTLISSHLGIDVRKLDIEASAEVFHADLWVRVSDAEVIEDLCRRTQAINGVTRATRIH